MQREQIATTLALLGWRLTWDEDGPVAVGDRGLVWFIRDGSMRYEADVLEFANTGTPKSLTWREQLQLQDLFNYVVNL